jgi:hypothetical protein
MLERLARVLIYLCKIGIVMGQVYSFSEVSSVLLDIESIEYAKGLDLNELVKHLNQVSDFVIDKYLIIILFNERDYDFTGNKITRLVRPSREKDFRSTNYSFCSDTGLAEKYLEQYYIGVHFDGFSWVSEQFGAALTVESRGRLRSQCELLARILIQEIK